MKALDDLLAAAKQHPQRIVLCEGDDPRILQAAQLAALDGLARVMVLKDNNSTQGLFESIDYRNSKYLDSFAQELLKLRGHRGMTLDQAHDAVRTPLVFANLMVHLGLADGSVAGAAHTTADVVRCAIQIIGKQAGVGTISSFFLMMREQAFLPDTQAMIFADCGLVINPDAQALAEIAVTSAASARALLGVEPRVAMLSFSTRGSAVHAEVDKVKEATRLARLHDPTLSIEGEMQLDAAIVASVAKRKWPNSPVAGRANVLIFPNLSAGNIGYKLVERIGGATALGPLLQGLNYPANDLSRGCSVSDIHQVIAVTAAQAIQKRIAIRSSTQSRF